MKKEEVFGKSLADAAEAVREDNKTYNEVVTIVFSLREFIGDNAQDIGAFGNQVVSTGLRLHLDCIRDIGTSIVRGVATLRKGLGVVDEFRDNAHPQNSRSINDAAAALDEVSKLMLNGSKVETYGGWVCRVGVLVSLLFVMNGLVLLVIGNNNSGRDR